MPQLPHPVAVIKPRRTPAAPLLTSFLFPFPQIPPYIPYTLPPSISDKNIPPSTYFSITPSPLLLTD